MHCCVCRPNEQAADRLLRLLNDMYGPECEQQWVHYAVHLVTSLAQYVFPLLAHCACELDDIVPLSWRC